MDLLRECEAHNTPMCLIEFNSVVSEKWRNTVLNKLAELGEITTLHAYDVWTVQPK